MNVLFLDYDGVVNTPMWDESGSKWRFNFPEDGKVNNFQAVQWISEFCQKCDYSIVVTSSWRLDSNYRECLINGGLRSDVKILGRTEDLFSPRKDLEFSGQSRGVEINKYLSDHPEIKNYIIVDDEDDCFDEQQRARFVQTDSTTGFSMNDMRKCRKIHARQKNENRLNE